MALVIALLFLAAVVLLVACAIWSRPHKVPTAWYLAGALALLGFTLPAILAGLGAHIH